MTDEEIEAIRERWQHTQREPWEPEGIIKPEAVAFAYQDMPALLAEVERLRADNELLRRNLSTMDQRFDQTRQALEQTRETVSLQAREYRELEAVVHRLRGERAAMREIVEAVARGDMTAAQEDFGTTPLCVFGCHGHEDPDEIEKFIHTAECQWTKARELLRVETE